MQMTYDELKVRCEELESDIKLLDKINESINERINKKNDKISILLIENRLLKEDIKNARRCLKVTKLKVDCFNKDCKNKSCPLHYSYE